jgi:hypothetical protein
MKKLTRNEIELRNDKYYSNCSARTQEEIDEGDSRIWCSFDCGYGQEIISYTKEQLLFTLNNDEYSDKKKLIKRDGVNLEPFGQWVKNAKWFDNYFDCKQYTNDVLFNELD